MKRKITIALLALLIAAVLCAAFPTGEEQPTKQERSYPAPVYATEPAVEPALDPAYPPPPTATVYALDPTPYPGQVIPWRYDCKPDEMFCKDN